jgi:hypothetical protein
LLLADEKETANNLAEAQIENVKKQAYDRLNNPPQYSLMPGIPSSYSIDQPLAQRLDSELDGLDDDDGIQKITVIVRHNGEAVLTLEDYKVD